MAFTFSILFFLLVGFTAVFLCILKEEKNGNAGLTNMGTKKMKALEIKVVDKADSVSPGPASGELRPLPGEVSC